MDNLTATLVRRFHTLWMRPVEGNFLSAFEMPAGRRIGFFPGSTI
ncbi:hypothetical protein [Mesorhizobium sp. A556]